MVRSEPSPSLIERYDTLLFDLDGVLYIGSAVVPGVPAALERVRAAGVRPVYVTNNASRTPSQVAEHLTRLGIPASAEEVVTSAQATAARLATEFAPGSPVLVIGGEGLIEPILQVGLRPVFSGDDDPVAVVQGFHPDLSWRQLAEGAYAVARGLPWIASNADRTIPTDAGIAPGNGAMIEVIRIATGRTPAIVGKPRPALFEEAVARSGATRPLVIGDRLDTDIEGAVNAGLPSLLVLTGVSDVTEALAAPPERRPTYVTSVLDGLFDPWSEPEVTPTEVRCDGWAARVEGHTVKLAGDGSLDAAIRAVTRLVWSRPDAADLHVDHLPSAERMST